MKIFQLFFILICLTGLPSCVILTVEQYETQKRNQSLNDMKSAVHHLLIDQEFKNDTADLRSLLRLISYNYHFMTKNKVDEKRMELIAFDLIKTYNDYWIQPVPFEFSERKLESEIDRYFDYIMNPDNEYVRFRVYWKKTAFQKFQSKIIK